MNTNENDFSGSSKRNNKKCKARSLLSLSYDATDKIWELIMQVQRKYEARAEKERTATEKEPTDTYLRHRREMALAAISILN